MIGHEGEQLGIFQVQDALKKAEEVGYDLVEISPTAKPPVCKIMDFGKFKYEQAKKLKDSRKNQITVQLKEVKMRPATGAHDLAVKVNKIREFLTFGHKVKVTVQFRGREMAHQDLGRKLLAKVLDDTKTFGEPELSPRMEGRFLSAILQPGKAKSA